MKLSAVILSAAALAGLAACSETKTVANQFEETGKEIANSANAIEASTENSIRATENALDQDWQNKTLEVNVSVENRQ